MTREDIIAMAREAGLEDEVLVPWAYEINMFAALVAAAAKAEEREALENADWTTLMRQGGLVTWGDAQELGDRVVDAIRARGETK